jgi:polyhydroxyalkanoate synthesis regulator phasin
MISMNDWIKKGFYLGLGAAFASKEKMEKYMNDLVAKGEMAPNEATRIIDDLSEKGKGKREEWNEQFREEITSSLKQLGFATKEEMNELNGQLQALEKKVEALTEKMEGNDD